MSGFQGTSTINNMYVYAGTDSAWTIANVTAATVSVRSYITEYLPIVNGIVTLTNQPISTILIGSKIVDNNHNLIIKRGLDISGGAANKTINLGTSQYDTELYQAGYTFNKQLDSLANLYSNQPNVTDIEIGAY